ncbi:hypothetical protein VCRA2128O305_160004 [Vibrio crassostreae]|nr:MULTISPECIES: hypothetical protein [Vibrio]CAH7304502.1 hypothetical protein VCHA43P275_60036 [Vibrio chagasii]MCC4890464.1 hypothetical protein [Vibrio sp. F13]CAH7411221.1 hypothetical protein VCHA53O473_60252 [Vibrio chagasii]CAK1710990.1 hypothetical protein VCRA2112O184_110004 [Vibrio crassostreae]CAK1719497.1 hypothetical protein VCRA2116O233_110128 [Vibrio crassostreae]
MITSTTQSQQESEPLSQEQRHMTSLTEKLEKPFQAFVEKGRTKDESG